MESRTEFQSIYTELNYLWQAIRRRWQPAAICFASVFTLAVIITAEQRPTYEAKGKILLEKYNSTSNLTDSGKVIDDLSSVGNGDPLKTEIEIINSVPLIQKTIDTLHLKNPEGKPLEATDLQKRKIKLKKLNGSDVLQIAYQSKYPEEAAKFVNQLMRLYLQQTLEYKRQEASTTRQFILKQIPVSETAVRQAETELRKFKEVNAVTDLDKEKNIVLSADEALRVQITTANSQLQVIQTRLASLKKSLMMDSQQAIDTSILSQTPGIQTTLEQLQQVETDLAIARDKYQESHPLVQELTKKQQDLESIIKLRANSFVPHNNQLLKTNWQARGLQQELMAENVKSQLDQRSLVSQIKSLTDERQAYEKRLKVLPTLEQEQRRLESKLDAASSSYQSLLKKLQDINITENQSVVNARILEPALVPDQFLILPLLLKLAAGSFAGALVFVLVVLFLEFQDKSIKTITQAKELFGYTLLGVVPLFQNLVKSSVDAEDAESSIPKVIVRDLPRSPISEAYRMLQSNLKFLGSDQELKVIVVTSSVSGEGKSTTSANLAAAMAQYGRRVVLVDADMRRPTQHHVWNLTNVSGLSQVIIGQVSLKMALNRVMNNLDVLTAGVLPPSPGALLNSKRMVALIKYLADNYDHVIFDTPSLSVADDPRILSKIGDGTLLVVRPQVLDVADVASTKERLSQLESNILGIVINGVEKERESSSYYYREYGQTEPCRSYQTLLPDTIQKQ